MAYRPRFCSVCNHSLLQSGRVRCPRCVWYRRVRGLFPWFKGATVSR
jgi:hypothetical protein